MALDDFTLDDDPPANARAPAPAQGDDAAGAEREAEAVEAAALSGGAHHPASALTEPAGRDGAAEAAGGEAGGPATEEGGEAPPGGGLQQARPQTVQKIQELDHVLDEVYAQLDSTVEELGMQLAAQFRLFQDNVHRIKDASWFFVNEQKQKIINTDLNTQAITAKLDKLASFMMASYQNEGLR